MWANETVSLLLIELLSFGEVELIFLVFICFLDSCWVVNQKRDYAVRI